MIDTSTFDKWIPRKPEVAAAPEQTVLVRGSYELNGDNVCPYCKKEMRPIKVKDMVVYLCDNDRAVVPAPNEMQGMQVAGVSDPQEVSITDLHRVEQMAYRRRKLFD